MTPIFVLFTLLATGFASLGMLDFTTLRNPVVNGNFFNGQDIFDSCRRNSNHLQGRMCRIRHKRPYEVLGYERMVVAAHDYSNINNNAAAVIDANHTRKRASGYYTNATIDNDDTRGLQFFKDQFCFNVTGLQRNSIGAYTLPSKNITIYPYAGLPTFQPPITSDNQHPEIEDRSFYWTDWGLILIATGDGVIDCGPLQGLRYGSGYITWHTKWVILRHNATLPGGRFRPACMFQELDFECPTMIVPHSTWNGDAQNVLTGQLISDNGEVGVYTDLIAIRRGDLGVFQGYGQRWGTSRAVHTWANYTAPNRLFSNAPYDDE